MKIKIKKLFGKILNFISMVPSLIMDTFLWLFFSYGVIVGNIFIIKGVKSEKLNTILERLDVLNSILTTNICFLVGMIFMMYSDKENPRKYFFAFSIIAAIISASLSIILIIQMEIKKDFFDINYIKFGMFSTFLFSILLALISKYDESKVQAQKYANKSRDLNEVKIKGKKLNI
jgi:cytochrome bd-type quinol oxidase subunit 2